MTINSVTCFSDAGTPSINLQRQVGTATPNNILASSMMCDADGETKTGTDIVVAESTLNLNDKLDFVMATAGGTAHRVTVVIKATVN